MILHCLFIQRKEQYEGQYAPELMSAIDEYTWDENPEGSEKEFQVILDQMKGDIMGHARINVEINQATIREKCLNVSTVFGEIV